MTSKSQTTRVMGRKHFMLSASPWTFTGRFSRQCVFEQPAVQRQMKVGQETGALREKLNSKSSLGYGENKTVLGQRGTDYLSQITVTSITYRPNVSAAIASVTQTQFAKRCSARRALI